jgi:hypothetical protein
LTDYSIKTAAATLSLELIFKFTRIADRRALLRPNKFPRAAVFRPFGSADIVITDASFEICRHSDVEMPLQILLGGMVRAPGIRRAAGNQIHSRSTHGRGLSPDQETNNSTNKRGLDQNELQREKSGICQQGASRKEQPETSEHYEKRGEHRSRE